jgi:hypothetical protein
VLAADCGKRRTKRGISGVGGVRRDFIALKNARRRTGEMGIRKSARK